jgi:soluble lytic murein transglycosylase-like protein
MMRRRGGLVRAAATTAVVAGTAGAVRHRQDQKYANQAAQQQALADQQAMEAQMAAQQAQLAAMQAAPAPVVPAAPAAGGIDMEKLKQLGELHAAGVLTDEEFADAKSKLLG